MLVIYKEHPCIYRELHFNYRIHRELICRSWPWPNKIARVNTGDKCHISFSLASLYSYIKFKISFTRSTCQRIPVFCFLFHLRSMLSTFPCHRSPPYLTWPPYIYTHVPPCSHTLCCCRWTVEILLAYETVKSTNLPPAVDYLNSNNQLLELLTKIKQKQGLRSSICLFELLV